MANKKPGGAASRQASGYKPLVATKFTKSSHVYVGSVFKGDGRYKLKFHGDQFYFSKVEYGSMKKALQACKTKQQELTSKSAKPRFLSRMVTVSKDWKVSRASLDTHTPRV